MPKTGYRRSPSASASASPLPDTTGGVAGAPLVRIYSAGIDLAPGFPSSSSAIVSTTSEAAGGTPVATTFYIAVFC